MSGDDRCARPGCGNAKESHAKDGKCLCYGCACEGYVPPGHTSTGWHSPSWSGRDGDVAVLGVDLAKPGDGSISMYVADNAFFPTPKLDDFLQSLVAALSKQHVAWVDKLAFDRVESLKLPSDLAPRLGSYAALDAVMTTRIYQIQHLEDDKDEP